MFEQNVHLNCSVAVFNLTVKQFNIKSTFNQVNHLHVMIRNVPMQEVFSVNREQLQRAAAHCGCLKLSSLFQTHYLIISH